MAPEWPNICYSSSIWGSWNSHWYCWEIHTGTCVKYVMSFDELWIIRNWRHPFWAMLKWMCAGILIILESQVAAVLIYCVQTSVETSSKTLLSRVHLWHAVGESVSTHWEILRLHAIPNFPDLIQMQSRTTRLHYNKHITGTECPPSRIIQRNADANHPVPIDPIWSQGQGIYWGVCVVTISTTWSGGSESHDNLTSVGKAIINHPFFFFTSHKWLVTTWSGQVYMAVWSLAGGGSKSWNSGFELTKNEDFMGISWGFCGISLMICGDLLICGNFTVFFSKKWGISRDFYVPLLGWRHGVVASELWKILGLV